MREMRVSYGEDPKRDADSELAELRARVSRPKLESQFPQNSQPPATRPTVLEPRAGQMSSILSGRGVEAPPPRQQALPLRQSFAQELEPLPPEADPYVPHYAPQPYAPVEQGWAEEAPQPEPYYQPAPPQGGPLLSPQASYAAQTSFQALTNSMLAQVGGDGRLEELAREILRPLLKQWLDENLPPLVEKLVREEIERVARRGR
ncbi:MAG: DUF2497 domain-containing protein [Alphaproteobacteria bacterium]|nr:DUF2497 domain-containing protein [Alphaproteobacteria bacterium]